MTMKEIEIDADDEDAWRGLILNNAEYDSITVRLSNGDKIEICSTWGHQIAADYYENGEDHPTSIRDMIR